MRMSRNLVLTGRGAVPEAGKWHGGRGGSMEGSMAPIPLSQDTPGTEQVRSFTFKPDSEHCPCSDLECPH